MIAFVLLLNLFIGQAAPVTASAVSVTPKAVGDIDLNSLRGEARRLSWSPDGTQLYLQTVELNNDASVKNTYHYAISPVNGAVSKLSDEPKWSADYWAWKSWKASPADESFEIALSEEKKRVTATATPMGGDMARGGTTDPAGGVSMSTAGAAAQQSQTNDVRTMKLKGQVIGEWINLPIVPGMTFGWAPKPAVLIAYAEPGNGRITLLDKNGNKKKVDDTSKAVLPAWSADGKQLAWLEAKNKKTYALVVAAVKLP